MYHFHIADDHPLFRSALLEIINAHFENVTITESSDLETTLAAIAEDPELDLLLLDLHMPGSQDLFGLVTVREKFPSIPVAVVSAREDAETISRSIGHGASAYIPKSASPKTIYEALQCVTEGEKWVPEEVRSRLRRIDEEEMDLATKIASLTPQQYKVLCFLREGWLNKQIGYEIGVTEATVKAHITAIFKKLGVSNRTQAVIVLSKLSLDEAS
ncbi:DNA-binding response regulator, partial [Oleiphilus sp. HI0043]